MSIKGFLRFAYSLEVGAAFALLLSLALPWSTLIGSGLDVMQLAIETKIAFGLDPFHPNYLPVSHWWIIWIIPLVAVAFLIRGIMGIFTPPMTEGVYVTWILLVFMLVSTAWYAAAFYEELEVGFWLSAMACGILAASTVVEFLIPEKTFEERYLETLPPDHPDRIWAGDYKPCPNCGEPNNHDDKRCRSCGVPIYPD